MASVLRVAAADDAAALRDLERAASVAALAHVLRPERFPYPDDDVLARWALVLDEPGVTTLVRDAPAGGLDLLVSYDHACLRHLAVAPALWGRGLGALLLDRATAAMARGGARRAELWCLVENRRARRCYERAGWRPTAERQPTPWPPHPAQMRYTRPLP